MLSRYLISRRDTYRDTWATMRYVSRYLFITLSRYESRDKYRDTSKKRAADTNIQTEYTWLTTLK